MKYKIQQSICIFKTKYMLTVIVSFQNVRQSELLVLFEQQKFMEHQRIHRISQQTTVIRTDKVFH